MVGDGTSSVYDDVVGHAARLLDYLSAVAREVGPEPVRDMRDHDFGLGPSEVPNHRSVLLGPGESREAWLEVRRVPEPAPVDVPEELDGLLVPDSIGTPDDEPRLSDEAVDAFVSRVIPDEEPAEDSSLVDLDSAEAIVEPVEERRRKAHDGIRAGFDQWRATVWTLWADRARPTIEARRLYGRLYELHLRADAEKATYEVVWGHAIMSCSSGGKRVIAPMLTAPMNVEIDADDATIRVVPERTVEVELDALEGIGLDGLDGLAALRAKLRETPPDPWSPDERHGVRTSILAPLGLDARLSNDRQPAPPTGPPVLNDGWFLFLRRRPMRQERFYDSLAEKLRDENFLPEALASVVADKDELDHAFSSRGLPVDADDGTAQRLLMPLPVNDDQERIARQLAKARGVTVQGPPGTGKSHTIVNLVSHLVAQGKRVLVTAQNDQALTVLRDKIPEQLRDLSIAVLGSTPAALEELRSSAQSMQDSISAIDVPREERRIAELGARIDELRESLRRTELSMVEALRSEHREFSIPAGPAKAREVAEWLARDRNFDVIRDEVPDDGQFPLTVDELIELIEIAQEVTPNDATLCGMDLPEDSWLPTSADLGERFELLDRLRDEVTSLESGGLHVEAVDVLDRETCRRLADEALDAARTLETLDGGWEDPFAAEILTGGPVVAWTMQQNQAIRERLREAQAISTRLAGHEITVPDGDPEVQLKLLQAWSQRIQGGKKLPTFGARDLKELNEQTRFDGYAITASHQVDLVAWKVRQRTTLHNVRILMSQAYSPAAIPVPEDGPAFMFAAQQVAERVDRVYRWWAASYPELSQRYRRVVTFTDPARDAESLRRAGQLLGGAAARLEERELTETLEQLEYRVGERSRQAGASPLWGQMLTALQVHSAAKWSEAVEETRRLVGTRTRVRRREDLASRLSSGGAPRWARAIIELRGDPAVTGDPHDGPTAWARARARTWLTRLHVETNVAALMERSHTESQELQNTIVEMASRSARVGLSKNMKDRQRRALDAWLTATKRIGKGTGKNAPRFMAQAREVLPAAMGAVPVWIMPIYRVLENFDPRVSDLFDVVVVDESSQCDLLSLGVLALGRKSVVVGDDKQTSPQAVGVVTDRIFTLQDQHIPDFTAKRLLTLDESLYSISGRAFPSTILLREHFRCVPEIIAFSNTFYDGKVLPLREVTQPQIGAPLNAVRVEDGASIKTGSHRVNRREAEVLVSKVVECADDPAYDGLTFGVVTMMSGPQARIIEDLLVQRLGIEEYERRHLRVGNPPVFQGDERHVVFISMVADDNSFAATKETYAQWVNVAASRAQDQIWLFHTMDPSTLNANDYRRRLIEHVRDFGGRDETTDLFGLTESKFEADVLREMLARGYKVTPQHKVGSYRIDFVVNVAPGERLAVECDGDAYHGPDKWDEDVRRQRVLERLGWSFWRIRASQYYLDPQEAMKPLWARLEQMRERAVGAEAARKHQDEAENRRRAEALLAREIEVDAGPIADSADLVDVDTHEIPVVEVSAAVGNSLASQRRGVAAAETMPAEVRAWARAQGVLIGDRGRIPADVYEAYVRTNGSTRGPSS